MKLIAIKFIVVINILLSSVANNLCAAEDDQNTNNFFSLSEIQSAAINQLQPLEYALATDDTSLAYRAYLPSQAQAIVVFYHGAGAHSGLSYQHIGNGLRDDFNIAVYMPDIRGHGSSSGERGDTPDVEQVWSDINTIVSLARSENPGLPIFVGGHSAGAGLALNYSSWQERVSIDGYVFLSPYFGFRSQTNFDEDEKTHFQFSSVNTSDFVINAVSGGLLFGHSKAVKFNFPEDVLRDNPKIVPFNTVNMSNAVTPHSPDTQLRQIQQFGLWIGENDEAFDAIKVSQFATKHSSKHENTNIEVITDENHFSIMLSASKLIGAWINKVNQ